MRDRRIAGLLLPVVPRSRMRCAPTGVRAGGGRAVLAAYLSAMAYFGSFCRTRRLRSATYFGRPVFAS